MYSYVMEFNLGPHGEETQEYLADAARTWPKLWGDIPGVTGTLLLCSAFALGGVSPHQARTSRRGGNERRERRDGAAARCEKGRDNVSG